MFILTTRFGIQVPLKYRCPIIKKSAPTFLIPTSLDSRDSLTLWAVTFIKYLCKAFVDNLVNLHVCTRWQKDHKHGPLPLLLWYNHLFITMFGIRYNFTWNMNVNDLHNRFACGCNVLHMDREVQESCWKSSPLGWAIGCDVCLTSCIMFWILAKKNVQEWIGSCVITPSYSVRVKYHLELHSAIILKKEIRIQCISTYNTHKQWTLHQT